MTKFKIGQKLFRDENLNFQRGEACQSWVTIEKVGRKWLTVDYGERVNIETLEVDGGQYSSPGQCYLTKKEYDEKVVKDKIWEGVRRKCPYNTSDISLENMIIIAKILNVKMEDTK